MKLTLNTIQKSTKGNIFYISIIAISNEKEIKGTLYKKNIKIGVDIPTIK